MTNVEILVGGDSLLGVHVGNGRDRMDNAMVVIEWTRLLYRWVCRLERWIFVWL